VQVESLQKKTSQYDIIKGVQAKYIMKGEMPYGK